MVNALLLLLLMINMSGLPKPSLLKAFFLLIPYDHEVMGKFSHDLTRTQINDYWRATWRPDQLSCLSLQENKNIEMENRNGHFRF